MDTTLPFPKPLPFERGRVATVDHASRALAGNPWGDPTHRDVLVYLPAGYRPDAEQRYPVVMLLAGFAGRGEDMLNTGLTRMSLATRFDRMILEERCPPFIAVMPDCMTSVGGSQHVDSAAVGNYASYLVHEIKPFVDGRFRTTGRWAVAGKSSGGFGALHLAGHFPGAFEVAVSHAGDAGFDSCYLGDLFKAVAPLRKAGGPMAFLKKLWETGSLGGGDFPALNLLGMAACYAPDDGEAHADGFPAPLPVCLETGAVDFELFASWRRFDPIVEVEEGRITEGLSQLRLLWIDAGNRDEYLLHLGARRLVAALGRAGVPHHYEEFDGTHRGLDHRYEASLPAAVTALLADG